MKKIERLKKGNKKLHNVWIFDLPAGKQGSCRLDCPGCYAKKAERIYPNVIKWRNDNFNLAKHELPKLKELLTNQLENIVRKEGSKAVVRIHSSGDFFSKEYFNMWLEIMEKFPVVSFYAYTKNKEWIDGWMDGKKLPTNFNLIDSLIEVNGKKYMNYGNLDYIEKLIEQDESIIVCPATDKRNENHKKVKCNLHCNYCTHNNRVVFVQH